MSEYQIDPGSLERLMIEIEKGHQEVRNLGTIREVEAKIKAVELSILQQTANIERLKQSLLQNQINFPQLWNQGTAEYIKRMRLIYSEGIVLDSYSERLKIAENRLIELGGKIVLPEQVFTYNYTSIYGTFTTSASSELIAYAEFQQWLKEKEAGILEPEPEPEPPALLSANVKISFTNPNIGGFSSSIPINDIAELQILSNSAPEWKYTLIGSSTNQPISTLSELINNINDLLATVEPEPDEPDITITDNMVTQQVINFNIVNGRAVGSIKFMATNNFNPFWYGKNIVNIILFKDPNGANILTYVKENRLNFTETERDEVISYDESMEGNTRATVESFVWSSAITPTPFSKKYTIDISETESPKPITSGFMGAGIAGAIAGLVLIGFIADHKRGK